MSTLKYDTTLTITDNSSGVLKIPLTKSVTYSSKTDREYLLTASSEQVIYDPTSENSNTVSNFSFLYISTNGDCELEIDCDYQGDIGRQQLVISLTADSPLVLTSSNSRSGVTGFDGFAGTLDIIDRISAKAGSASEISLRFIIAE